MNEADWEALCKQCGACCFEKDADERGRIITTTIACRYLDIHTRQCQVYDHRFDVGERCVKLTPEVVRRADWLPKDCAYQAFVNPPPIEVRSGRRDRKTHQK